MRKSLSITILITIGLIGIYIGAYTLWLKFYADPFSPQYSETLSEEFEPADKTHSAITYRKSKLKMLAGDWKLVNSSASMSASIMITGDSISFHKCSGIFANWSGQECRIRTDSFEPRTWFIIDGEEVELTKLYLASGFRLYLGVTSEMEDELKDLELVSEYLTDDTMGSGHYLFARPAINN